MSWKKYEESRLAHSWQFVVVVAVDVVADVDLVVVVDVVIVAVAVDVKIQIMPSVQLLFHLNVVTRTIFVIPSLPRRSTNND